jgi:DNA polymerase III delta prime subunit
MSISQDPNEFLWVQKYRPKKISECILPAELKSTFQEYANGERLPSLLLAGGAGVGNTTVAKALCDEVGADWIMINGSMDSGIDTLRNEIRTFASSVSFDSSKKVVIIDEADYLPPASTQPALRSFAEEFSKNCTFILTCNYKNRIIPALQSRFTPIEFKIPNSEKAPMAMQFMKRATEILELEGIEYEKKVLAEIIQRHFPDFRRILNELQRYSVSGKIDSGIFKNLGEESFDDLVKFLKEKKFNEVRKWVTQNADMDSVKLFSDLYHKASVKMQPKSIPELVLILGKYSYQAAFVADQELNNMACLTEIMMGCEWL